MITPRDLLRFFRAIGGAALEARARRIIERELM